MILILEDNLERVEGFTKVIEKLTPAMPFLVWSNARKMLREMGTYLADARLISLDHDLEPTATDADPGEGLEVARWLGEMSPVCPVILHSSNGPRAVYMAGLLDVGGWQNYQIAPLGDNWIEQGWYPLVRRLLRKTSSNRT